MGNAVCVGLAVRLNQIMKAGNLEYIRRMNVTIEVIIIEATKLGELIRLDSVNVINTQRPNKKERRRF